MVSAAAAALAYAAHLVGLPDPGVGALGLAAVLAGGALAVRTVSR